jgi:hypothetical protein
VVEITAAAVVQAAVVEMFQIMALLVPQTLAAAAVDQIALGLLVTVVRVV